MTTRCAAAFYGSPTVRTEHFHESRLIVALSKRKSPCTSRRPALSRSSSRL